LQLYKICFHFRTMEEKMLSLRILMLLLEIQLIIKRVPSIWAQHRPCLLRICHFMHFLILILLHIINLLLLQHCQTYMIMLPLRLFNSLTMLLHLVSSRSSIHLNNNHYFLLLFNHNSYPISNHLFYKNFPLCLKT